MTKTKLLSAALLAAILSSTAAHAGETPCEDALKALRALEQTTKAGDSDKAEAAKFEAKGIERCNADDDKRANEFFAQATKLLSK